MLPMLIPKNKVETHAQSGTWIHHDCMNHLADARMQCGAWKRYSAADPVEGLLKQVRHDLSLDASTEFTLISSQPGER